jgi:hypothetical protein
MESNTQEPEKSPEVNVANTAPIDQTQNNGISANNTPVNSEVPVVSTAQTIVAPSKNLQVQAEQVNEVINSIVDLLDGRKLTPSMVIRVVANCMRVTAKMKVSNSTKKKILIESVEKFINDKSGLNEEEIQPVMTVVDYVLNEAIDTIADVSSGKLQINKGCCSIM